MEPYCNVADSVVLYTVVYRSAALHLKSITLFQIQRFCQISNHCLMNRNHSKSSRIIKLELLLFFFCLLIVIAACRSLIYTPVTHSLVPNPLTPESYLLNLDSALLIPSE